ncbi:hypothetical protein [Viridibacillus arvi]|uniref:hypothetical protein n=1 Tax=Viridibacillus arvi TaxID=263475 RepID=UPI0034CE1064
MIINHEEVVNKMQNEEKKISLKSSIKQTLTEVHHLFHKLNDDADIDLLTPLAETERKINIILLNKLNMHPLVDLMTMGYKDVYQDSIQYLFVPKEEVVDSYLVDIITIFFKYKGDNCEINVTLPVYLVTENEQEYIVLIDNYPENLSSVESLTIFN